jgi:hypothetical protein
MEGEMLRLGWITFHSHIPRLIGICVASLSLSLQKENISNKSSSTTIPFFLSEKGN